MNWNELANYGVLKVDGTNVKLYKNVSNYESVYVGQPIDRAVWAGTTLVVYLQNGTTRRYKDRSNYETIY